MRLELIQEWGGSCCFCPEQDPELLEFAHVSLTELKGRGRGRKERYYDVKKHPEAYLLMCKACHEIYDVNPEYFDVQFMAAAMEALFGLVKN